MNKRKAKRKIALGGWAHHSKKDKEYYRTRKKFLIDILK